MKTIIYYFSGTGNSLKTACDLALQLADTEFFTDRTEVFPMARAGEADVSADRIGMVFPVYMSGPPLIVSGFVKKLAAAEGWLNETGKYIFAVATHGGNPGGALKMLYNDMRKNGLSLDAAFNVAMPGNYTPLYGALSGEKQNALFVRADEKLREISARVLSGERGYFEFSNFFVNAVSSFFYGLMSPRIPGMDKKFFADGRCDSCGICAKVCPVDNIKMLKGKPSWNHKCQQCMACLHWCPKEAIQYGKMTRGRRRYNHPLIKLNEIIQK